jgi:uncharacterized protein
LDKPGRDPRPEFKTATFKEDIKTLGDLKPGMMLEGVVTNVTAFGAFVDVGVHQDGLVHISALAESFVKDPHKIVSAGDIVRVKVLEVDKARKRIGLTMRLSDKIEKQQELVTAESEQQVRQSKRCEANKLSQQPQGAMAEAFLRAQKGA